MENKNKIEYFTGCLLGGAIGDALGWPVEFSNYDEITGKYGPDGIQDIAPGEGGLFEITDDTQMTLFTAEGLLRAWATFRHFGGVPDFTAALWCSYHSWLKTQGVLVNSYGSDHCSDGWLINIDGLHQQREPGNTCLSALRDGALSESDIINNLSKGCGGVMRAAPAGLLAARICSGDRSSTAQFAFDIGCAAAALTHGHPSGYYPAGALAAIIATIITGGTIEEGIGISLGFLRTSPESDETITAVQSAIDLWRNKSMTPSPETVELLGSGWVGEEALAIAIYCALAAEDDFLRGVRLAVNHSGDSDTTGSITGNILGALLGEQVIPRDWMDRLELVEVIKLIGNDLYTTFEGTECWLKSYPPEIKHK